MANDDVATIMAVENAYNGGQVTVEVVNAGQTVQVVI